MIGIMLSLGGFQFCISTAAYQAFSHSTGYRWQGQERFGQLPAMQYTGPGEDSITLSGDIYPSFAGGLHQIDSMRYYASQGTPLLMVDGNGYIWGRWVIQSIEENKEVFFSDGTARKQTFNLKITRYAEDAINPAGQSANEDWVQEFAKSQVRINPDADKWADNANFNVKVVK